MEKKGGAGTIGPIQFFLIQRGDHFDLDQRAFREGRDFHARPGCAAREVLAVNRVEGGKIADALQEARGFHDVREIRSCGRQNCLDVAHDLAGLLLDGRAVDRPGGGVDGDLPRDRKSVV